MTKTLLIPRTTRQVVWQALAIVAVVEVIVWILFRYHYHVHMPLWYWPLVTIPGFVWFIALLSFMRWLHREREEWSRTTKMCFGVITVVVGVALLVVAFYIRASR